MTEMYKYTWSAKILCLWFIRRAIKKKRVRTIAQYFFDNEFHSRYIRRNCYMVYLSFGNFIHATCFQIACMLSKSFNSLVHPYLIRYGSKTDVPSGERRKLRGRQCILTTLYDFPLCPRVRATTALQPPNKPIFCLLAVQCTMVWDPWWDPCQLPQPLFGTLLHWSRPLDWISGRHSPLPSLA